MHQLSFPVHYEDEDLLVIHKPAGIHSSQLPSGGGHSIATELAAAYPNIIHASDKPEDAGLVQRLDAQTEGLLIGAKNKTAWIQLSEMLRAGQIEKSYQVILEGKLTQNLAVESLIGAKSRRSQKVQVFPLESKADRALPASTSITPVRYADSIMATLATVKASPARRHQVRAHCAYKGFPLVGDSLYGAKTNLQNFFPEISAQFFLFAHFLRFRHPTSGTEMNFLLDLPPAIKNIF